MSPRRTTLTLISAGAVLAALLPQIAMSPAIADGRPADALPAQAALDGDTLAGGFGGWSALSGGVAGRPSVVGLTVQTGATQSVAIIDGAAVPDSPLTAVVRPVGLCPDGPHGGLECGAVPDRIEIAVAYLDGAIPRADLAGSAAPAITPASVIDLTVDLGSLSPHLRWTWASGEPTFWSAEGIGTDSVQLHIRFHPGARPVAATRSACVGVPVKKGCDAPRADHVERQAVLVVSLNPDVNQAYAGTLIATTGAYAGSLETEYAPGEDYPTVALGMAAPSAVKGAPSKAQMWVLVNEVTLLNEFAIFPGQKRVATFFKSALINGKSSRAVRSWSQWTAQKQGTNGWMIEVPGTRPGAAVYDGKADRSKSAALVLSLPRKYPWAAFARKANDTVNVIMSASEGILPKVCRTKTCRVTVNRAESRQGLDLVDISHRDVSPTRGVFFAMLTLEGREAKGIMVNDPLITVVEVQTRQGWERLTSGVIRVDKPL